MTGMEANKSGQTSRWRTWLPVLGTGLAIVTLAVAARNFMAPDHVTAQAPVARANQNPSGGNTPPGGGAIARQSDTAAVINSQPISRFELGQQCMRRFGVEVLESIINRHLIVQACQAHKVVISDQDVTNEIKNTAAKFNLPVDQWLEMLQKKRNITLAEYRNEIVWPTIALRELAKNQTTVSREELDKAVESEYGAQIRARLISVATPQEAEEVRQAAASGQLEFADLARKYSQDASSASVGGLIPPIRRHVGEDIVWQTAFQMKPGQISNAIPVANQFIFLQCEAYVPATSIPPSQMSAVLTRLEERIRDHKLRAVAGGLFKQLQANSKVVTVFGNQELQAKYPGVAALINNQSISLERLSGESIKRHGTEVLEGEINRVLLNQALKKVGKSVTRADIDTEIARAADAFGYWTDDDKPDVHRWLKSVTEADGVTIDLYIEDAVWPTSALKKLVDGQITVTQEDMQKGFESSYGPRVEVMAIVLNNQRRAQEVWQMARENPTEQLFGDLANRYSIEPVSRANFGKVPPIRKHGGQDLLEKHAFNMQSGEQSDVIAVKDKFIILKCLGQTKPVVKTLDEKTQNELFKDLHEKKLRIAMNDFFQDVKAEAQIDNYVSQQSQVGKTREAEMLKQRLGKQPAGRNPLQQR
jgi:parvulin-like peptidyl-prolyl isomerase